MAKPPREPVDQEAIRRISEIVGLDVDAKRAAELAPEVQAMRDALETLMEIDLTDVEPAMISPVKVVRP